MASDVTPAGMPCGGADTEITSASEHSAEMSSASEHHREITSTDKQYDVFISHRGPDTKSTFVSYLCKDLEAAGLQPFLDCRSIDMGEKSWECIENAIKRTPIAVVVFSAGFAASEWCLRELDVMLGTPGVKVRPVFYNVRPNEVRLRGSGQLKDGFEKLSRRHDKTLIDKWRGRLEAAAEIMGWEYPGVYKLEADLVKDVVGEIVALADKALPLAVGDYVIGVKEVAEKIVERLKKKKEVLMLGLWGMGGIGKSTLAKELYNQMYRSYDAACYVEGVTETVTQSGKVTQGGVVKVQQHMMKDLCRNNREDLESKSLGKSILEERLCKKRFLLVLDDVPDDKEMRYLISSKMLTEGSMCIVTSRDRSVFATLTSLDERQVHIHNVEGLSNEDSERLFMLHAFEPHGRMEAGFEELVSSISKGCGGVPLVLIVCGGLLKQWNKMNEDNVGVWKEVEAKLNDGRIMDEKKIYNCFLMSFDALRVEEQEMFLDIACALIGERKDLVMRAWKGSPKLGIRSLMERALITVDEEGCLRMHDHLRDMGREIERKRRENDEPIRRLWMPESLKFVRNGKQLPETLRTLHLWRDDDMYTTPGQPIDLDVSHLTNLRVLKIFSSLPGSVHWSRFPIEYTLSSFPRDNELAILDIWNSKFSDLGKSLGKLGNLEVLCLQGCANLTMLSDSFGALKKLRELKVYFSGIEGLSRSFGELSNLEVLHLNGCHGLTKLPDSIGRLVKLRVLKLRNTGIWRLPRSFKELSNLEVLHLSIWNIFTMPSDSFGALKNVQELKLFHSEFGTDIPVSAGVIMDFVPFCLRWQWRNLRMVLTMLGGYSGGLEKGRELMLYDFGIESLRRSFREMSNLKVLDLSECRNISTLLLDSFGGLQAVRTLKLFDVEIRNLPNSIGELSNLEVLDLSGFGNLTMLPESFGGLKNLRVLWLYCSGIESLPMSFGKLGILEVLNMSGCKNLTMLPDSFVALKKLQELRLDGAGIQNLPRSFGELSSLEVLDLSWCSNLAILPNSFGGLKKMRELRLHNSGLQCLPISFGELSNLELLNLSWCNKLTNLPDAIGGLQKMRVLWLYYSGIESLPTSFGELSNLELLDLTGCDNLAMLPNSFGGLKKMRELRLHNSRLQCLPMSFGELSNLEVLDLSWCSKLTNLPDSIGGLQKMRVLWLYYSGIESLPTSFGELSNLEMLNMKECSNLATLPDSFGDLKKIQILHLSNELKKVQELKFPNLEI